MTVPSTQAASRRVLRTHIPDREAYLRLDPVQATAYLFPAISALKLPDQQVAARLQRDARVVVSPGYRFGSAGVGYFRVCLTRDETEWHDATEAMVEDLIALGKEQGLA